RLPFHPLSGFPRLAAATSLYRVYHEKFRGGEFLKTIHELHAVYGAVVRIGPDELHFNGPIAYNGIYSFRDRYKKEPSFYKCFGVDQSTFDSTELLEAKARRRVLGPLFSRRSVLEAEYLIQREIRRFSFSAFPSPHWLALQQEATRLINYAIKASLTMEEQISVAYPRLFFSLGYVVDRRSLTDETLSLLQAGSDTLVQELLSSPRKDLVSTLRSLPYLTAVIKESLRFSHGFVSPLPRLVEGPDRYIAGIKIPSGTIVGMSVTSLHNNGALFPSPEVFDPERWLRPESKNLESFLAPFSKGPRMCLGINLAWMELYLIFGNVFRRLHIELHSSK
ncbi:Trichodiene oxygenase, partial [Leucoagaricus sp. SymC.cos]